MQITIIIIINPFLSLNSCLFSSYTKQTTFENFISALAERSAELIEEEERGEWDDTPEEFLDPIMQTVMKDPVTLPSSRQVCDRSVIMRHLMSESTDPFNRQHLTEDMLVPNDELREKIEGWLEEKKRDREKEKERERGEKEKEKEEEEEEKGKGKEEEAEEVLGAGIGGGLEETVNDSAINFAGFVEES